MIPRCPFAIWTPGPRNTATVRNFGYVGFGDFSPKRGAVLHDSTGPLAPTLNVVKAGGVPNWHFTVDDATGLIYQHYEAEANCWHGNDTDPDDGVRANIDFVGIEHTRPNAKVASSLTEQGISATVALNQWLAEAFGFYQVVRFPDQVGAWALADHNQVGNTPTACPSGRIPFDEILRRINEGEVTDDMAIIVRRPETAQNYLVVGKALEFLHSKDERELLAGAYGISSDPRTITQAQWDALVKRSGQKI